MPELPEVEMVVRGLRDILAGRKIVSARLLRAGLAPENPPRQFAARLRNAGVIDVGRRGKHILIHFSNSRTLITHLRMTGRFFHLDEADANLPHTHAEFHLDNQRKLIFTDQRHFGFMMVARTADLGRVPQLEKLAPEPFEDGFSAAYLHQVMQRSRQEIKVFLLDQTRVTGLGNIYASEALHRARINPGTRANRISAKRVAELRRRIIEVLDEAINAASNLATDPREVYGRYGARAFEETWRVYDREGQGCLNCFTPIRRIVQATRSTYFCPRCQK
ncbi:MAG: bifunctional DNA-formamidopyrimidine glycosylase/DNA-(apurinic or apyrimidinic site) lyase [Acidobacteriota bacterium]|nr:MAG: bifunctional DNA-formamidopyrimidine glycosylase/DNA-(apurinic or apyrimidinic site) lyase [Acidobacteriota bacterium]